MNDIRDTQSVKRGNICWAINFDTRSFQAYVFLYFHIFQSTVKNRTKEEYWIKIS